MPRETTLSLIRRYYDAFNAGDPEGMLACLADDIEHRVNEGGHRIGRANIAPVPATVHNRFRAVRHLWNRNTCKQNRAAGLAGRRRLLAA